MGGVGNPVEADSSVGEWQAELLHHSQLELVVIVEQLAQQQRRDPPEVFVVVV